MDRPEVWGGMLVGTISNLAVSMVFLWKLCARSGAELRGKCRMLGRVGSWPGGDLPYPCGRRAETLGRERKTPNTVEG